LLKKESGQEAEVLEITGLPALLPKVYTYSILFHSSILFTIKPFLTFLPPIGGKLEGAF